MSTDGFKYSDETFADIAMLRYRLNGFDLLTLKQKTLIYYLSEAALSGRDITFDQFGRYNLRIRKMLEHVYETYSGNRDDEEWKSFEEYLKQVWFSNGIYHHYSSDKFKPQFSEDFLRNALGEKCSLYENLFPVIFNPSFFPKKVDRSDGADVITSSACNFYEGVTQQEVESFYDSLKDPSNDAPPSYGLNSTVIKCGDKIVEHVWFLNGRYGKAIKHIVYWLEKALGVAENEQQRRYIELLVNYYKSGDLTVFNEYCIEWVKEHEAQVDFVNGFIEVYSDPIGLKGSWESIVEYKDLEATGRTQKISNNAQWFEDHSPVDPRFKKKVVRGVTANVICAAMLGGDEYPSTAIGINLPNADWIRANHGSKSITISNITEAYKAASRNSGFREEFVIDEETLSLVNKYDDVCDDLHTDLHECLGHGSGQLLSGVDPDSLKTYGNTIEEARADLFGLYYIADEKLVELGLVPDVEAYKSQYYTYMLNGLMTQLTRIRLGDDIEEAHMRNRALIAHWCYEHGDAMRLVKRNGKTYLDITDYPQLRRLIAELLAEVQRIKSTGDYAAARELVERYAVKVDKSLHEEILERYQRLKLAPYKGFINPVLKPVYDNNGEIADVSVDYSESYSQQMLRYSKDYGYLI